MKITINCEELKKAVDKVSTVIAKKPSLSILECIMFQTDECKVTVTATDCDQFAVVNIPCTVSEPGYAFINKDAITKAYGFKESIELETAVKTATFKGAKKKVSVPVKPFDLEDFPTIPKESKNKFVTSLPEEKLAEVFTAISAFTAKDHPNKIFNGINFNINENRLESCDGHRATTCKLTMTPEENIQNFILPTDVQKTLKAYAEKKGERKVDIFVTDKYASFVYEDGYVISRLTEGVYIDINKLAIPTAYTLELSAKELETKTAEYAKANKEKPMFLRIENGKVITGIITSDYQTADVFEEIAPIEENFYWLSALDAKYIAEGMKLFKGNVKLDIAEMKNELNKIPISFRNDEWTYLVLPANTQQSNIDAINNYVKEM